MKNKIQRIMERNSNIELLRILSAFLITLSHWAVHSDFVFPTESLSLNQVIVEFCTLGEIGVCIFVITTGYYSIKQKPNISGFFELLIKIWIYNIICLVATYVLGLDVSIKSIVTSIVPVFNLHWFAYTFLILYLLRPYINYFVSSMNELELRKLLIIIFVGWSLIHTLLGADLGFSNLGYFIFLYFLGAYMRLYGNKEHALPERDKKILLGGGLSLLLLLTIVINLLGLKVGFYPKYGRHFYSLHSPLVLLLAMTLFKLFISRKPFQCKIINVIASSSFGIYLISDNPLLRNWVWNVLFNGQRYIDHWFLFFVGLGEVILVFVVCMVLDFCWTGFTVTNLYAKTIIGFNKMYVISKEYCLTFFHYIFVVWLKWF